MRFAVGDTTAPGLFPDETYSAALALLNDSEAAAVRSVAGALAVQFAQQPTSISDDGSSLNWAERVRQWNLIAAGEAVADPTTSSTGDRRPRVGMLTAGTGYVVR
jgi:hypothetical protein